MAQFDNAHQSVEIFGDRFTLTRCIGRGGFGEVWLAEARDTGQRVAIKILLQYDDDAGKIVAQRFLREAQTIATLTHPNTVRLYDFGTQADGTLYMVLEYLEGETLEERCERLDANKQTLSQTETLEIGIQVCKSLAEAHSAGMVHRDIKPSNLMLAKVPGDEEMVRVLDFGVARTRTSKLTAGGQVLGTPQYMSPEQCLRSEVDGRADLYSLGVVLYRCVCGRAPYVGKPHAVIMGHLSGEIPKIRLAARVPITSAFAAIVEQLLQKQPEDRFASARELRAALESVLAATANTITVNEAPVSLSDEFAATAALEPRMRPASADVRATRHEENKNDTLIQQGPTIRTKLGPE